MSDRRAPYFRRKDELHDQYLSRTLGHNPVPDGACGFPGLQDVLPPGASDRRLPPDMLVPTIAKYVVACRGVLDFPRT